jgi:hypothetical protein
MSILSPIGFSRKSRTKYSQKENFFSEFSEKEEEMQKISEEKERLQQNQMFNENEIKSLRNCEEIEIFI